MPLIQERLNKVGAVLVHEYKPDRRYCRTPATLTFAVANTDPALGRIAMEVGEIVILDGANYREIVQADVAAIASATLAVVIDDRIEEKVAAASGATITDVAMLIRGPSAIVRGGAQFGNPVDIDETETQAIIANLEAAGIDVLANYSVRTKSRLEA